MSKHIITKKTLIKEYKKVFISDFLTALLIGLIMALLLSIVLFIYSLIELKNFNMFESEYWSGILVMVLIGLWILLCFLVIKDSFIEYRTIKKGKYTVATAVLADLKEMHLKYEPFIGNRLMPHTLKFEKYGEFIIPTKNYTSDPYTAMTDDQVFNSSIKKDVFILILNKKNKILLAYNTKLFEYQD